MQKPDGQRVVRWLIGVTFAAVLAIVWGALFLIAPVWQWPASADGGFLPESFPSLVDVNAATAEELTALPGIGPEKAAAIVAYREKNGPFASLQDLDRVDGISAQMIELWEGLATAEESAMLGSNTD